jgi:hypothetical protein
VAVDAMASLIVFSRRLKRSSSSSDCFSMLVLNDFVFSSINCMDCLVFLIAVVLIELCLPVVLISQILLTASFRMLRTLSNLIVCFVVWALLLSPLVHGWLLLGLHTFIELCVGLIGADGGVVELWIGRCTCHYPA